MAACLFGERYEALRGVRTKRAVKRARRFMTSGWRASCRRAGYLSR